MDKLLYIHGLGGSGNGISANNVKKALEGIYEVNANSYDLLAPTTAFEQIKRDAADADVIIASSLGGFYASALNTDKICILLNPCLNPAEKIPTLLYPEQREHFNQEKCVAEWKAISDNWNEFDWETKAAKIGIFSDGDEYFSFEKEFEHIFGTSVGKNHFIIHGTHEIAKDMGQLTDAISQAWDYLERVNSSYDPGHMFEKR